MLIRQLKLKNFGKFNDKEIEFKEGINIVYGDNEAGKSTVHTFIQGMLFGITKTRGRVTKEDTYMRYMPWSNPSLYQGSMDLRLDEKEYRFYRNFHKDYKNFRITDIETGREIANQEEFVTDHVPNLNESNYKNTISITQKKSGTEKELVHEVQNYIANLSTSKDSEVNVSQALTFLQNKKKLIEGKKTKEKLAELKEYLKNCEDERKTIDSIRQQLLVLEKRIKVLGDFINEKLRLEDAIASVQIKLQKTNNIDYQRLEADIKEYEEILSKINELNEITKIEELKKKETFQKDQSLNSGSNIKKVNPLFLFIPIILSIGAIVIKPMNHSWIFVPGIWGIFCIYVFYYYKVHFSNSKKDDHHKDDEYKEDQYKELHYKEDYNKEETTESNDRHRFLENLQFRKEKILNYYRLKEYDELVNLFEKSRHKVDEAQDLKNNLQELHGQLTILNNEAYELSQSIVMGAAKNWDKNGAPPNEEQPLIQKLHYANQCDKLQYEKLKWELERLDERQDKVYEEQQMLERFNHQLQCEDLELKAISLASRTIEELSIQIHDSFGLTLSRAVSEVISRITDGRYSEVKIDEKLNIKVLYEDEYVPFENLSVGTVEQIYLALRLEIADLFYGGNKLPLILDDSFAYYDDKRLKETLETLYKKRNQVIIFTCHKRESRMLDELDIPYHLISMT